MRVGKNEISGQRQKVISYKKFFGSDEGKEVFFDLMNKFHVLNTHHGDSFKEGQRSVVLWIMSQARCDLAKLDQLLKGEL